MGANGAPTGIATCITALRFTCRIGRIRERFIKKTTQKLNKYVLDLMYLDKGST